MHEVIAFDAYKKSFPAKQSNTGGLVKDIQRNAKNGTGSSASVGLRSGASSMADASALNVSTTQLQQ